MQKLTLGRILYLAVYAPFGRIRKSIAEGGPLEQRRTAMGELGMRAAANDLPVLPHLPNELDARVHFLTGSRHWHQTLFCYLSLQIQLPFRVVPTLYDDGTFCDQGREAFERIAPWTKIETSDKLDEALDARLPESKYPTLRKRRKEYPHLRKLVDIHSCSNGYKLVLDSDMLFFRWPQAIVDWFERPHPVYMQDIETAYGYPLELLSELTGRRVPERVNVGLYGFQSEKIDWEQMEFWCRKQIERHGPHYFQEQALTAMLFNDETVKALPIEDYRVLPSLYEGNNPTAVLHHYVLHSKRAYFQSGWRRINTSMKNANRSPKACY